jgi:ferrous iron transport protein B
MNAEMDSKKWLWAGVGFQFGVGYTVAFFTYQIGTLITTGSFGSAVIPGFIVVAIVAGTVTYLIRKNDQKLKSSLKEAA